MASVLVVGYHCFSRTFAYIGIPPAKIFLGEIVLGLACLIRPEIVFRWWLGSIVRLSPLATTSILTLALMGYGVWEVVRGLSEGYDALTTLQTAVFVYYPLYFFFGVWAGLRRPGLLATTARALAITAAIYGVAWVAVLAPSSGAYVEDGEGLFGFSQPSASGLSLLVAICMSRSLVRDLPVIAMIAISVMAIQVRAEWLACVVGIGLWAVLARRAGLALGITMSAMMALGALQVLNIQVPGRTGNVSLTTTIARLAAPIAPGLAEQLNPDDAAADIGSADFRAEWWAQIWKAANSDPEQFLVGGGFGFPLRSLVYESDPNSVLRTPHGVFFFALGYLGWIGVILFFSLELSIGWLCFKVFQATGNPCAIVYWAASMTISLMSNTFETPFGAIPFYLFCGMAIDPIVRPLWEAVRPEESYRYISTTDANFDADQRIV